MRSALAGLLLSSLATGVAAQADTRPAFEVASVRPNAADWRQGGIEGLPRVRALPGGRVVANKYPVGSLILWAYGLKLHELETGDSLVLEERFDITAQGPPADPPSRRGVLGAHHLMMQRLLEERFRLRLRAEERMVPGYVLTRADPARLGPKMTPSTFDCMVLPIPRRPDKPGFSCGFGTINGAMYSAGTIAEFADHLTQMLESPVIDRTGLTGIFEMRTAFNASDLPLMSRLAAAAGTARLGAATGQAEASLATALREDLGLKLERERVPARFFVVEQVERPAEN